MSYLLVVAAIGVLILVHECGHFIAARLAGIPVAVFSIGFGRSLWSVRRGATEYRLSLIPLGGYVLLDLHDEHEYLAVSLGRRLAFSLAGPAANVLLALPLLALMNALAGHATWHGVVVLPFLQLGDLLMKIVVGMASLLTHHEQLSSVLGIVSAGGGFVGDSLARLVQFAVMITLNLAIFNLLPLPPLDGGKMLLDLLHRVHPRTVRAFVPVCLLGWALLIGLFLYATVLDVGRMMA